MSDCLFYAKTTTSQKIYQPGLFGNWQTVALLEQKLELNGLKQMKTYLLLRWQYNNNDSKKKQTQSHNLEQQQTIC